MLRTKHKSYFFMNLSKSFLPISTRQICVHSQLAEGITNLSNSIEEKLKAMHEQSVTSDPSIYRVPSKLRSIDPVAYGPHFVSIGPYHRGLPHLVDSEGFKWGCLKRVVGFGGVEAMNKGRDTLLSFLDEIEPKVRGYYSEDVGLSRDAYVEMMLLDGCFIVELFRDLKRNNFVPKRWMLPVVRRDLITLENQLPFIVLKKIFQHTFSMEKTTLEELVLRFFDPLLPRNENLLKQSIASISSSTRNFHHLLDIFHFSISRGQVTRGKEPHMYRSVAELREAGIKVRVLENSKSLEVRFKRGVLQIPYLQIGHHTGSFFRNIVAYEQCHHKCKPDMTSYLFFLDKLINSAQDVGLLHYQEVIQHSLGSNDEVAKLVNKLCFEVEYDGQDSYLYDVVQNINSYSNKWLIKAKTKLKHEYFSNVWVGISTLAALLFLYLTLLQTSCDAIEAQEKGIHRKKGFWVGLNLFLVAPVEGFKSFLGSASSSIASVPITDPKDPSFDSPQQ